jgi:hypothetical protein
MGDCRVPFRSYEVRAPQGSPWEKAQLRLFVGSVQGYHETDVFKVALQVVEGKEVIAEDPLSIDYLSGVGVDNFIQESILEGWKISLERDTRMKYQRRTK